MEIEVTARGDGIPDQAKDYAREKMGRLARFFDRIGRVHISLERGKEASRAHAVVHLDSGSTLVGDSSHSELRGAIEAVAGHLERQVRREKERLIDRTRKGTPDEGPAPSEHEPTYDEVIRDSLDGE